MGKGGEGETGTLMKPSGLWARACFLLDTSSKDGGFCPMMESREFQLCDILLLARVHDEHFINVP